MDYLEKLKDPRWQKKRLEIFERDKWTCKNCSNKDKTLHIHHLFYFSNLEPWEIPDGFLVTLCEDCHTYEKERYEYDIDESLTTGIGNLLNALWRSGYDLITLGTLTEAILKYSLWDLNPFYTNIDLNIIEFKSESEKP